MECCPNYQDSHSIVKKKKKKKKKRKKKKKKKKKKKEKKKKRKKKKKEKKKKRKKKKKGATTIYEDSEAYAVSASNLTMEVDAFTHALHWIAPSGDSQTTQAIILADSLSFLQKVKSGMGKPRLACVNARLPLSNTPVGALPWTCQSERK